MLRNSSGLGIPLLLASGLLALVIAVIGTFEFSNWNKVTPGVSALGTPVGGTTRPEAIEKITPGVARLLDRPLQIRAGEKVWNTTARELGLRLDADQLVEAAWRVGRVGSPSERLKEQVDVLRFGRNVSVSSTTDQAALDASLGRMAREVDRAPRDAKLTLSPQGAVQYTSAAAGFAIDVPASRERLSEALANGSTNVELASRELSPAIPDEQLRTAREQLDRLVGDTAEPFVLSFGNDSWKLERADVLKLLSLEGGTRPGERAVVNIDEQPLRALAQRMATQINQDVQEARFAFNGGNLRVLRESREGRELDQPGAVNAIKSALLSGERSVPVPVAVTPPATSSQDPKSLGITELIERGSTSFAGSIPEKKANIKLAAQRLNGVVVPPGGTFSFNKEVGPTTIEAGFKWGFGITSGNNGAPRTVPTEAGGICQVATTLFHPVFWAGYQLEERFWHLYWIPGYTSRGVVGLDVTVDESAGLDFKWVNPTDNYVLIQADADEENVYFGLYGRKPSWKVQVDDAMITNRTPPDPKPVAEPEPTLPWGRTVTVETARDGFEVLVKRRVIPSDGGRPRELDLRSVYQPARTVTLVGTAGKPANASVEEALQRVLDAQKPTPTPVPATAVPTPPPGQPPAPAPNPNPAQPGAPAPNPAQPGAPAQQPPAAPAQQAAPTATPQPAAPKPQAATATPAAQQPQPKPQVTATPARKP